MVETLVVRWSRYSPARVLGASVGVSLLAIASAIEPADVAALVATGAAIVLGITAVAVVRPRYELDADELRAIGLLRSTVVAWNAVIAVEWLDVTSGNSGPGWAPVVRASQGVAHCVGRLPEQRIGVVNAWLRQHQPEVRIDPKPPWRDRFGEWHVAEPGYDPVETMRSIRRSLVGPWEIVARSCEGGFRATQRLAKSGDVVGTRPVRTTLREAIADGVDLVRVAVVDAESATV